IHWLTQSKRTTLRVDLWNNGKKTAYAQYQDFSLGIPESGYELHVGRYSGTAGNSYSFTLTSEQVDLIQSNHESYIRSKLPEMFCTFLSTGDAIRGTNSDTSQNGFAFSTSDRPNLDCKVKNNQSLCSALFRKKKKKKKYNFKMIKTKLIYCGVCWEGDSLH
uniref:Fibrinogen C-terminal domain-containing protein n=1 Tax=Salarias fasciatus TaxID=181472 RepID=A0A672J4S6_SALFA